MISFLLLIAAVSALGLRTQEAPKVTFEFYFESYCSGCVKVVNYDLWNIINDPEMNSIVDLKIVPFGNGHVITRDPPTFECQHGEKECYGNMIYLCAMEHFPNTFFPFMDYLEGKKSFTDELVMSTASKTGLRGEDILKCAKGTEGPLLHLAAADATPADHKYVPWHIINGKHYEFEVPVIPTICSLYTGTKPKMCFFEKYEISLFYESLCPGCANFITHELYQFYLNVSLRDISTLTLYPFGNGKVLTRDPPTFQCQHGEEECYGNMIEACGMKFAGPRWYLFANCSETYHDFSDAGVTKCAHLAAINPNFVLDCARGTQGPLLQLAAADATPADHKYVPWLTMDGKWVEKRRDIQKILCETYPGPKPLGCKQFFTGNEEYSKCMNE